MVVLAFCFFVLTILLGCATTGSVGIETTPEPTKVPPEYCTNEKGEFVYVEVPIPISVGWDWLFDKVGGRPGDINGLFFNDWKGKTSSENKIGKDLMSGATYNVRRVCYPE